jgi:transcriptional regulator with XRE-family HTH domain
MSIIRELRAQLGQSQAQFAVHFHVNQATISRWENIGVPDKVLVDSEPFIDATLRRIRINYMTIPLETPQEEAACTPNSPEPSTEPASTD